MGFYSAPRRHVSYQAYLAQLGDVPQDISTLIGSETAAEDHNGAWKSIGIGVATGALTYLVTKFLERAFK